MPLKFPVRAATLVIFCALATRAADTTNVPLLPARLGPMESVMWSEHGLMRKTFDFPLTEEGRDREMHLRRTMLNIHEIGGFATLAAMIATCAVGQLVYNGGHDNLRDVKSALGWTTVAMYFTTASFSILSPPPLIRRDEWSSVSTHKLLATVHFTGMILTPLLATMIEDDRRGGGHRTIETVHMVSGYATTATFAAAMLVITF